MWQRLLQAWDDDPANQEQVDCEPRRQDDPELGDGVELHPCEDGESGGRDECSADGAARFGGRGSRHPDRAERREGDDERARVGAILD